VSLHAAGSGFFPADFVVALQILRNQTNHAFARVSKMPNVNRPTKVRPDKGRRETADQPGTAPEPPGPSAQPLAMFPR
jgi:hypothetical protein